MTWGWRGSGGGQQFVAANGSIIVPAGALDRWKAFRDSLAAGNTIRREIVAFGDSTTYGSGGLYSWCQRLRDDATGTTTGGPAGIGLADGGKGMFGSGEGGIGYDAPEVNGFVSATGFGDSADQYDTLVGQYYSDNGSVANRTLTLQFRTTAFRLWYVQRAECGDFSYAVDGGAPVTVAANGARVQKFIYVSGLSANTTHTLVITNLAVNPSAGDCHVALAPVNATGFAIQKQGTSGATINDFFFGQLAASPFTQSQLGERWQPELGLTTTTVASPGYDNSTFDLTYAASARVAPVLALTDLGFNDLTNVVAGDVGMWTEYVKRFAGACQNAHCDGIIVSGQLPLNVNWPTYGPDRFRALRTQAAASGLGFIDFFYPIGGPSLSYAGGSGQPHLTKAEYQAQADFLWNSLLAVI